MTNKTIEPFKWMTAEDWHADRRKHFGEADVERMKREEELMRELGNRIGYGRTMQLAQQEWRAKLVKEGHAGGEHTVGCCATFAVVCGCNYIRNNPGHCEWCCGAGWVTRRVREAQILADNTIPAGDNCA